MKHGILLVNLGSPIECSRGAISKYLRQFLMDSRVIDIPFLKRWLLVNLIIVPTRSKKVLAEYKKIFTSKGSPLVQHGDELCSKLQKHLGEDYKVLLAMRYQEPSIKNELEKMRKAGVEQITIFPLFPQYASATTGSVHQEVLKSISQWHIIPNIRFVSSYHSDANYIKACAQKIKEQQGEEPIKHLVFSYHGLPQRQIDKTMLDALCKRNKNTKYNYQEACLQTSALIAEELGLENQNYSSCFQSRLGKEAWIKPYTSEHLLELIEKGKSEITICSPSFVADCLETTLEIGEQYKELFLGNGGKSFKLIESLNSDTKWVQTIAQIIKTS